MGRRLLLLALVALDAGLGVYVYQANKPAAANAKLAARPVPVLVGGGAQDPAPAPARGGPDPGGGHGHGPLPGGRPAPGGGLPGGPDGPQDLAFPHRPPPLEASLNQAQANLGRDQAQLDKARLQLTRNQGLAPKGYVSTENLEDARAASEALEATVKADQAAVELARLQLAYATLHAPIDGLAGARLADPGNLVKTNDTALVTINQIEPIYVAFALPERHLAEVRRLLAAGALRVEAQPQDGGPPVSGAVGFLDNKVDPTTGTIGLRATFPNTDHRLLPGQFVTLDLALGELGGTLVVPSRAVQVGQKGEQVYVVTPEGTAELRPVTLGPRVAEETAIRTGLVVGDRVVIDGQMRLTSGAKVEVRQPPAGGQ
jgi:multidrug efflux system membrane fusion protein